MEKKRKLTCKEISLEVRNYFYKKGCQIAVPNTYALYGVLESDILAFTKQGFVHEIEIKRTTKDYRKDFEKTTHAIWDREFKAAGIKEGYNLSISKHELIRKGEGPNYYWFAVTENVLYNLDDLPEYVGIIKLKLVDDGRGSIVRRLDVVRHAQKIHKNKVTPNILESALRAMVFKYWGRLKKDLTVS